MNGPAWCFVATVLVAVLAVVASPSEAGSLAEVLRKPAHDPEITLTELRAFLAEHVPALTPPGTAGSWTRKSGNLRRRLLDEVIYRGVPAAWREGNLGVSWGETLHPGGGYSIRKLRYEAVPGMWIPALLYVPDGLSGKVPAVLNVNGHVGAPGKAIEYEQIRCINLAKRGMLALHPEWLNCGELTDRKYTHNRLAFLDLCGVSGVSVFYLAMRRGLDLLETLPNADPKRLAMTGLSGGGWQTIWLGALERRIAATAPNAGYIGMGIRFGCRNDIGDLEQNPTDLLTIADYSHLTAMLAPRPALLIYNEKDDCCFQTARAKPSVYDPIVPFYARYGKAERFAFHNNTVPGTHNYDEDNRVQFYRFLQRELGAPGAGPDVELPTQGEVQSFEALREGLPQGNAGFGELAERFLDRLPLRRLPGSGLPSGSAPPPSSGEAARWQSANRRELRLLLKVGTPPKPAVPGPAGAPQPGPGGTTVTRRTLRVGERWTVPVVEVSPARPTGTAIVVAEGGRAASQPVVEALLGRNLKVRLVDLLLLGDANPPSVPRSQHAMMLGAAGERLLGLQTAQLLSVCGWSAGESGSPFMVLAGQGRIGATIAACAAALSPRRIPELLLVDPLPSLNQLIRQRVEFDAAPELYCFGLLEAFDVRELLGMARTGKISVQGANGRAVVRELSPVVPFQRAVHPGFELAYPAQPGG
jgi:dienelactone hydrolase